MKKEKGCGICLRFYVKNEMRTLHLLHFHFLIKMEMTHDIGRSSGKRSVCEWNGTIASVSWEELQPPLTPFLLVILEKKLRKREQIVHIYKVQVELVLEVRGSGLQFSAACP